MQLFNTLTRKIEEFKPRNDKKVGLYACGFTVYDYTHLGHLRKYTMDDVLIRTLRHAGYEVKHVQNVTDVGHLTSDEDTGEDKLEKGAKKYHKTVWEVAKEFEAYFFRSMDLMGNLRPDVSCRATEHIPEQIELVKRLEAKGFTYIIDGDGVYFDTSKFPSYGQLAKLDLKQQKAGARVEVVAGKRNSADFALWKFERPGENRAMSWESPWSSKGFPGWHIECSAMAIKYLGEQFDIHTGGIDHIPVHHTNEIAQAEGATGKSPFVKYWVHHNFLRVDGEKMSKSLGNFFTIDDLLQKGFEPMAMRLLILMSHYRDEMNFTWQSLQAAQTSYTKMVDKVAAILAVQKAGKVKLSESAEKTRDEFFEALEKDLDTPQASAVLFKMMKSDLVDGEKLELIKQFDEILGLQLIESAQKLGENNHQKAANLPQEILDLLDQRKIARENKDFGLSDKIRDQIKQLGYDVRDEKDGQVIEQI